VSYSSKRTDRLHKRRLYSEEGVPEYWIVDTEARHIERWRPAATNAEIVTQALAWQPVASLPALTRALDGLFQDVWMGLGSRPGGEGDRG